MFVDLKTHPAEFYVAPEWWVENTIHERNVWYLAQHGGTRPVTPDSKHGLLLDDQLAEWKGRWDVLGILPPTADPKEAPVAPVTEV